MGGGRHSAATAATYLAMKRRMPPRHNINNDARYRAGRYRHAGRAPLAMLEALAGLASRLQRRRLRPPQRLTLSY